MTKTMQVRKGQDSGREQDHLIIEGQEFTFDQVRAALAAERTESSSEQTLALGPDFSWYQGQVDEPLVRRMVRFKQEGKL